MGILRTLFGIGGKSVKVHRRLSKVDKMKAWGVAVKPGSNSTYIPKGKRK